ncbi:hypothetical protein SEA_WEST99_36 [Mycobacterium phage West99]|uniref:DUF7172 domain-containing protein n=28 Tax=Rosebushvirus TaxID=1982900 RepID=A0A0Y0A4S6_9CAUD|nr:gp36 [Mycobacterium phage Rosebush]YP_009616370.1 hypothetical protein FDI79_gp36 [Mycobacterium phage Godines]YP_010012404.1 hypothetical protein J3996_gp36 [Mycobacterium phage Laurie]YP_655714.1 gp34 [Mycobacterium phage Qyrzula]AEN79537.1 hypothetical protein ARBITER_36 [Mycobacterium phage Arbiter]AER47268.1 hypothetical protein HEDGEROW_36 [Mycobacterium phage Hedgerow]AER48658.1 hypothetical protein ARES_36 [Mycobacterium phage Ares]AIK68810.1 hypothetical protein PBI_LIZLEMON_36 [
MAVMDFTEPNVCIAENLTTDDGGLLRMQPWAVPRVVRDVKALANDGNGKVYPTEKLPGKLLINQRLDWRNDTPLEQAVLIRVTRAAREWVTSNPNAIQFRDRWSFALNHQPSVPVTSGYFNSQLGSAIDLGTNSVAEPEPGVQWNWVPVSTSEEWVPYLVPPGSTFYFWYRCYLWTPPPWSDNANKNSPKHTAFAKWTRCQLWAFPQQGNLVAG